VVVGQTDPLPTLSYTQGWDTKACAADFNILVRRSVSQAADFEAPAPSLDEQFTYQTRRSLSTRSGCALRDPTARRYTLRRDWR
jgi:hypothetical protein